MHEHNYQQLHHTFFESYMGQEQTLNVPPFSAIALSHIWRVLYRSGTYLIRKGNFFTAHLLAHLFSFKLVRN